VTNELLHNLPHSDEVWRGIGGHFDSLSQVLCEFVDNSIANLLANQGAARNIAINFKDQGQTVRVTMEDTGSGIEDLANAFRLGGKDQQKNPLNEHGFGMKHALASANPENNSWIVCTRTNSDLTQRQFKRIQYPYKINELPAFTIKEDSEHWPGQFHGTGTHIEFSTSKAMFNTLRQGIQGNPNFGTCVRYLIEDLGFVYSGLIERNVASFSVTWESSGSSETLPVEAVRPEIESYYHPGQGTEQIDLGGGNVKIHFTFASMKEGRHKKYYKRNMSSSGLEIRINGRALEHNIFKEVWQRERHNMFNHLLVMVNIESSQKDRLPSTRTSKNGIRQGDPMLEQLLGWVRTKMPDPPKDLQGDPREVDLFEELAKAKRIHLPPNNIVNTEQLVFKTIGERVRVDLYVSYGGQVIIYEGKKESTTVQDVYQLAMYWDGASLDGVRPTLGILIASEHPESVKTMIDHLNSMRDATGEPYKFQMKLWRDEGIDYPR